MPIKVPSNLPAKQVILDENIFTMDELRSSTQQIRPLEIAILNLMPVKEDTEVDLMRSMSNTPLQLNLTFVTTGTYQGTHTKVEHLDQFYETFESIKHRRFDGLLITGAPVEMMEFEEVAYWEELAAIMEWSKTHVTSTLHICWGAQAGLYYHYGIHKRDLGYKIFGVYPHTVHHRRTPFIRGFDDIFYAPHSRYTESDPEEIRANPELTVLAESEEAGVFIVIAKKGRQVFVMGHPEYDRLTLDREYRRDIGKGIDIQIPKNYYPDDDPTKRPRLLWRGHANTLYSNWLNYYVYQVTPYRLDSSDEEWLKTAEAFRGPEAESAQNP